jgi:serine/threonine-protein kinase
MTEALTQQQVVSSRYQVQRTLGKGGMALVLLADDMVLGRKVALKALQPAYAYDRAFVERFRREAQAAARLDHPNIVRIYDLLQSPKGRRSS